MKWQNRLLTAAAVLAAAVSAPSAFALVSLEDGKDHLFVDGSFEEGKFVALFGRAGRLRAAMAIGRPRRLMGYRPLLESGSSWDDALAHEST